MNAFTRNKTRHARERLPRLRDIRFQTRAKLRLTTPPYWHCLTTTILDFTSGSFLYTPLFSH